MALSLLATAYASSTCAQTLTAGAGQAVIDLSTSLLPLQQFSVQRDPLRARALVLGEGDAHAAILVIDLTSISEDNVANMRDDVAHTAAVPATNVLVVASHTFSAPHVLPARFVGPDASPEDRRKTDALQVAILAAAHRAIEAAVRSARPARLAFGSGISDVNVNRDLATPAGWWLGANETGPSDKTVQVVDLQDDAGNPIALVVDYAVQSSILNESIAVAGGRAISADLQGAAMDTVEAAYPGAISMFLTGAAGDQSPSYVANAYTIKQDGSPGRSDLGEKGFVLVDLLGDRLGEAAVGVTRDAEVQLGPPRLEVLSGTVRLREQVRPRDLHQIHPSHAYHFQVGGEADAPFTLLRLGDVVIVGVQAELSSTAGERIRRQSPFAHTVVATMVNGAAKYMPDIDSYARITYEAMNSNYAKGSAETFTNQIVQALMALHRRGG